MAITSKKTMSCYKCASTTNWQYYWHLSPFFVSVVGSFTRIHLYRILSLGIFKVLGIHDKSISNVGSKTPSSVRFYVVFMPWFILVRIIPMCHRLWTLIHKTFVIRIKLLVNCHLCWRKMFLLLVFFAFILYGHFHR